MGAKLTTKPDTSVTLRKETFEHDCDSLSLEEDKLEKFYRKNKTEFKNYLIDTQNTEDFYFANGYLFYKDYFFYERTSNKNDERSCYDFKNLAFIGSRNNRWAIDTYSNKNSPVPSHIPMTDKPVISLSSNNNIYYFHWMHFPSLINISAVEAENPELLREADFYLGPSFNGVLPEYAKYTLEKLGVSKNRLVFCPTKAPRMISTLQQYTGTAFSKQHLSFLRKNFLSNDHSRSWPKKVFVGRRDTGSRHIINESELYLYCRDTYGFEYVSLADMTLKDQINVFANADIIVGAHGAGLTNVGFGKEGQWLIELVSPAHINNHIIGDRDNKTIIKNGTLLNCFPFKLE
ncbi:MAG: glycosyltransferase family 61 protein, partial [Oligoflexales bacterium]|nr:glycosyltransferase family 61 protein [Oligoflexales bacterium]